MKLCCVLQALWVLLPMLAVVMATDPLICQNFNGTETSLPDHLIAWVCCPNDQIPLPCPTSNCQPECTPSPNVAWKKEVSDGRNRLVDGDFNTSVAVKTSDWRVKINLGAHFSVYAVVVTLLEPGWDGDIVLKVWTDFRVQSNKMPTPTDCKLATLSHTKHVFYCVSGQDGARATGIRTQDVSLRIKYTPEENPYQEEATIVRVAEIQAYAYQGSDQDIEYCAEYPPIFPDWYWILENKSTAVGSTVRYFDARTDKDLDPPLIRRSCARSASKLEWIPVQRPIPTVPTVSTAATVEMTSTRRTAYYRTPVESTTQSPDGTEAITLISIMTTVPTLAVVVIVIVITFFCYKKLKLTNANRNANTPVRWKELDGLSTRLFHPDEVRGPCLARMTENSQVSTINHYEVITNSPYEYDDIMPIILPPRNLISPPSRSPPLVPTSVPNHVGEGEALPRPPLFNPHAFQSKF